MDWLESSGRDEVVGGGSGEQVGGRAAESPAVAEVASARPSESLWRQGIQLELAGDRDGALAVYVRAHESGEVPVDPRAKLRKAELLAVDGDHAAAERAFTQVASASEPDVAAVAWCNLFLYAER